MRSVVRTFRSSFPWLSAAAGAIGASRPLGGPMWVGAVAIVLGLSSRRRAVVLAAVAFACSVFAGNAIDGLRPLPPGDWVGAVTLVTDPTVRAGATVVDATTSEGRVECVAFGATGRLLAEQSAGARVLVEGAIGALSRPSSARARHVRARLTVRSTRVIGRTPWSVPVDALRSVVLSGARPLPSQQRPVYGGFVLGDDRGRSDEITRWFEAAGLSHLLVVSGENVVFVLLVASPLLQRLGPRPRLASTMALLLLFAAMTRFEPSILRATAMALVVAMSISSGRRVGGRVSLGLAVTGLLLVDPLLVHSLGFLLSVAASAGIVLLAPMIERRLPGPRRLRVVLAVTIAAQVGVAPLAVPAFGPLPLVALPANVLAEPVAGLVMMWGCTGGVVAGLVGGPVATVLQWPTRAGLWWIITVARVADSMPDVGIDLPILAASVASTVLVVLVHARRRREVRYGRTPIPG